MVNELNFPLHHENEPPRFDASIDQRTPREFSRNLNAVLCAIFMLSFFSFSPPEDFTSEGLGTRAILFLVGPAIDLDQSSRLVWDLGVTWSNNSSYLAING